MRLVTTGRFAVTAMLDLALHADAGPVKLAGIGQRQRISQSHLEQLFARLGRGKLVRSTRGPGGGYSLARRADQITVAEIIVAVDRLAAAEGAARRAEGGPDGRRLTVDLWAGLNMRLLECLASITLQDLVDEQVARGVSVARRDAAPSLERAFSPRPVLQPIDTSAPNSVFALAEAVAT